MEVNDQKAANALYLAIKENLDSLQNLGNNEDLFNTAFWLFHRMKRFYDADISNTKHHESNGH